ESVGAPVAAAGPEAEAPKTARRVVEADVNGDRSQKRSGQRVEGVDLAGDKAEIADQQVVRERTKTGRGESNAPRRGQLTAKDRLHQCSTLVENRHRSHRRSRRRIGRYLGWPSGRRIGHSQIPVSEGLHVERDEVERADRGWGCNCAHLGKGTVEDVDTAGTRRVGGVQLGLSLV